MSLNFSSLYFLDKKKKIIFFKFLKNKKKKIEKIYFKNKSIYLISYNMSRDLF
jgi:hypothetical protein